MSEIVCKRCRRKIRGREFCFYCINHRGLICGECEEFCKEYGHEYSEGYVTRYGEFILNGRRSMKRGRG